MSTSSVADAATWPLENGQIGIIDMAMIEKSKTGIVAALDETLAFLGVDYEEAAKLLGVSARTLRRWVDGEEIPGPAQAALRAWRELHSRHLAWKPDSISLFENDKAQIERARQHAEMVAHIIKTVEERGGTRDPWTVNMARCLATFGPFEVGFYKLANGGFSFSAYRRLDGSPDPARDRPYLEDAAFAISKAFSRIAAARPALQRVASYIRQHSGIFVTDGPASLPAPERKKRQRDIEAVADKIDELAASLHGNSAEYNQFEELLRQLHLLGSFPTIDLVSDVAKALL
jgi:hypothetical protein